MSDITQTILQDLMKQAEKDILELHKENVKRDLVLSLDFYEKYAPFIDFNSPLVKLDMQTKQMIKEYYERKGDR